MAAETFRRSLKKHQEAMAAVTTAEPHAQTVDIVNIELR